jgi:four helix bundle protein
MRVANLDGRGYATGMNYKDLDIWKIAREAALQIHRMTLTKLPKFECYETASQIRRAAKSIRSNIVEGYGRRRYKLDFIKHLTYSHASCDETIDHLEELFETGSLTDETLFNHLLALLNELGAKLNRFIASVESGHKTDR